MKSQIHRGIICGKINPRPIDRLISAGLYHTPLLLKLPKPLPQAVCVLTLAAVIFTYSQAFQDLSLTHRQYSAREVQIQTALEQGKRELTLAPITGHSKYNCYPPEGDLGLDSAQWPNTSIALFHGLDAIHSTQEEAGNG